MFDVLVRELAARFGLGEKGAEIARMALAYITNPANGGISGFLNKFDAAGLGGLVRSWMGGGDGAQSISPAQVETVLGDSNGLIAQLTNRTGVARQSVTSALTYLLPSLVGKLTPGGSIPTSLPADVTAFLGGAGATAAAATRAGVNAAGDVAASAGSGLMRWIPWLIAAAAGLFLLNFCAKKNETPAVETNVVVNAPADAATAANAAAADASAAAAAAGAMAVDAANATASAADAAGAAVADAASATASAATAVADAAAAAIPAGAAAIADLFEGKPRMKVYFDTGKTAVSPDFAAAATDLVKYMADNKDVKAQISGFNDPTGNAAANAELSKNRAKAVRDALKAAGVEEARIELVKPTDTTAGAAVSNAEARRVEVTLH